ncbi:hypothetical protein FSP39_016063 [Pinctada imbricata]|uniref:purine-nucleoside phosphorylase n=1 Tax=Pinctada imbricata TaxID=66713 RepID=A0AA88XIF9_PINIB|nr:hypothetical protein FSP39_016063 [Pinctada imbricata]
MSTKSVIMNGETKVDGVVHINGMKRKIQDTNYHESPAPKRQCGQYEEVQNIKNLLFKRVKCRPTIGIVCGSGIGGLADVVEDAEVIKYGEIPGFAVSTVPGHKGQLVFGTLQGKSVVLMQGRIALPIRVMHVMGVKMLILTNAAGGLNESFNVGDIMVIKDHINMPGFAGMNPLVGTNDDRFGPRFPAMSNDNLYFYRFGPRFPAMSNDNLYFYRFGPRFPAMSNDNLYFYRFGPRFPAMSNAYSLKHRKLAHKVARELGFHDFVREGVYNMLCGPNFESVAECRYIRMIGADATGMSTAHEALVARHCGMEILGMSLITNKCVLDFDSDQMANHEEVLETGAKRSKDFQKLVSKIVEELELQ